MILQSCINIFKFILRNALGSHLAVFGCSSQFPVLHSEQYLRGYVKQKIESGTPAHNLCTQHFEIFLCTNLKFYMMLGVSKFISSFLHAHCSFMSFQHITQDIYNVAVMWFSFFLYIYIYTLELILMCFDYSIWNITSNI